MSTLSARPTEWTAASVPLPPSVNRLYYKSSKAMTTEYRNWRKAFSWLLFQQKAPKFEGPFKVEVVLPAKMRGDADNRLKGILDGLVENRVTPDDKHCVEATARKSATRPLDIGCMIIVRAAT